MTASRAALAAVCAAGLLALSGCASGDGPSTGSAAGPAPTDTIAAETKADSVALRLVRAHGLDAWDSVPYLRFNFAVESSGSERVVARHFWDRSSGDYRVEWSSGPDTSYVALVNVNEIENGTPAGSVYRNGDEVSGDAAAELRRQAYRRHINDSYWLLAPLKAFDPGVRRSYVADSSTAEQDVIRLSFGDVGLTPDDRYWLYVDRESGRLERWAFHLQGMPDEASAQPFAWTETVELDAPRGTVRLPVRKESLARPQAILTNALEAPASAPEGAFSNPEPMLASGGE